MNKDLLFKVIKIYIYLIYCYFFNYPKTHFLSKPFKNQFRVNRDCCPGCLGKKISVLQSFPYIYTFIYRYGASLFDFLSIVPNKYYYVFFDLYLCKTCNLEFIDSGYKGLTDFVENSTLFRKKVLIPYYAITQKIYTDEYIAKILHNSSDINKVDIMRRKHIDIISKFNKISTFIEIGSNMGSFSNLIFHSLPNISIVCSEINQNYINESRKRYPNLKVFTPKNIYAQRKKYDCVYMCDVLEHIWDIDNFIAQMKSIISKKGYIFITTPNINSSEAKKRRFQWWSYIVPHHCQFFSKRSICALMKRFNFLFIKEYIYDDESSYIFRLK